MKVRLHELGHARAGDKGNTSIVSFFCYDHDDYSMIRHLLTVELVEGHFGDLVGEVRRYEVPTLDALHFVMADALAGGVTTSVALDAHGKTRSFALLDIELEIPVESDAASRIGAKRSPNE